MKTHRLFLIVAVSIGNLFNFEILANTSVNPENPRELPSPEEIAAARPTAPPPTAPPSETPDSAPLMEHLKLLNEFLALPPEKLESIRKTIAVIESMDEDERARLRANVMLIQADLEKTEDKIGNLASELTRSEKKTFKRYWLSLTSMQRENIELELAQLTVNEKTEALRQRIGVFTRREQRLLEDFRSKKLTAQ